MKNNVCVNSIQNPKVPPLASTAIDDEVEIPSKNETTGEGDDSKVSASEEIMETKLPPPPAPLPSSDEPQNEDEEEAELYRLLDSSDDLDRFLSTEPITINTEQDLQEHLKCMKNKRESKIPIFLRLHKKNLLPNCTFDPYRYPEDHVDILITDEVKTAQLTICCLSMPHESCIESLLQRGSPYNQGKEH